MFVVLIGLLGLVVGSFINAVVWRLHLRMERSRPKQGKSESIVSGRSMCPSCRHQLSAVDLVPVISWLWLKGKCRYCGKPISMQYPAVELLTAVVFALAVLMRPSTPIGWVELVFWLAMVVMLLILAVYDLRWYLLPDVVMAPAMVLALVRLGVLASLGTDLQIVAYYLVAAVVAGGSFYLVAFISDGRWMGGGDIKLAFLMGLVLGPANTAVAMLLAFNSAAIIGITLIAMKVKSRQDYIPFGPFLTASTILAWLLGGGVVQWYLKVLGV
jgi:leader peptidase (prepilin peptidase) / N-methyltransferase